MRGTDPSISRRLFSGGWTRALAVTAVAAVALVAYTGVADASSHNFKVYNFTSKALRLKKVDAFDVDCLQCKTPTDELFEGKPEIGTRLEPGGEPQDFELKSGFGRHFSAIITYDIVGTNSTWTFRIENFTVEQQSQCISTGFGLCKADGNVVSLRQQSGTITIPAGQGQAQVDVLKELCVKDSSAKCNFAPDDDRPDHHNPTDLYAPTADAGNPVANCTNKESDVEYEGKDTVSTSTSYELEFGIKVESEFFIGKAEASMTSKFGQEWGKEHEFSQKEKITNDPGHMAYMTVVSPIKRYYGTYTMTLGDTKWVLPGVYFDTANPNGTATFATHSPEMTPQQYAQYCPSESLKPIVLPKSAISLVYHGTARRNVFLGGPTSDTYYGKAGNDILRGGAGNDTLYGGPGRDRIVGGPGRDTIYGGPGADVILDSAGPTVVYTGHDTGPGMDRVNVRDGRGDDTVYCQTRRTIVVADRHDRIRGACGKVIRGHER
jgi:RTX calcium-binding nonapeptide repeat (4 copies)